MSLEHAKMPRLIDKIMTAPEVKEDETFIEKVGRKLKGKKKK